MSNANAAPPNPGKKQKARNPSSRLVRAKDAAAEIGIPYTSLRDLVFRGEIPVLKVGKAWYFERRDLEGWISSRKERLS
jgi:excisionase family DNA binding protein